jgi:hypothetical protein
MNVIKICRGTKKTFNEGSAPAVLTSGTINRVAKGDDIQMKHLSLLHNLTVMSAIVLGETLHVVALASIKKSSQGLT